MATVWQVERLNTMEPVMLAALVRIYNDKYKSTHLVSSEMPKCTGDCELEQGGTSLISSLLLFLCGLAVVGAGLAVSLLWVYTEGRSVILNWETGLRYVFLRLDSKSIATALPVLQADVEEWMGGAGNGVVKVYSKLEEGARPYVDTALVGGKRLWAEGGEKVG